MRRGPSVRISWRDLRSMYMPNFHLTTGAVKTSFSPGRKKRCQMSDSGVARAGGGFVVGEPASLSSLSAELP
jgi:hypothetical protein